MLNSCRCRHVITAVHVWHVTPSFGVISSDPIQSPRSQREWGRISGVTVRDGVSEPCHLVTHQEKSASHGYMYWSTAMFKTIIFGGLNISTLTAHALN